ncbi:MAG: hypothetical protein NC218_04410 [Acetobacter sp.]|nr:hypothetical protein [Acetobacter sp.]
MSKDTKIQPSVEQNIENYISDCEQMRQDSIKSQDKLLITLSSGALALSLSIYEKIFNGNCLYLLIFTWIFYFISLLSTLFSFQTAQITFDEQIVCFTAIKEGKKYNNKRFIKFNNWTKILNYISTFCFITASLLFIIFSSINLLEKDKNMVTIDQDGLTTKMTHKILTEGLTPNKATIKKIENGLTPNSISKVTVTEKSTNQPSSKQEPTTNNSNKEK